MAGASQQTEPFGAWLEREILAQYPSKRKFAEAIDMSPEYLSRVVKGKVGRPFPETCDKFADKLGIDRWVMRDRAGYNEPASPVEVSTEEDGGSRLMHLSEDELAIVNMVRTSPLLKAQLVKQRIKSVDTLLAIGADSAILGVLKAAQWREEDEHNDHDK